MSHLDRCRPYLPLETLAHARSQLLTLDKKTLDLVELQQTCVRMILFHFRTIDERVRDNNDLYVLSRLQDRIDYWTCVYMHIQDTIQKSRE